MGADGNPIKDGEPFPAWKRAVRARALDALRGLLPASTLSNLGIYASGQSYEALLVRMRSHELPEVRYYAELMLVELRKVIPSFLDRVDRPDRGGARSLYLEDRRNGSAAVVRDLFPAVPLPARRSVDLVDYDDSGEEKVLAAIGTTYWPGTHNEARSVVKALSFAERKALMGAYVADRCDRRDRPGRAFEATNYGFEIVSDYGAFRDLQRHRMLTIEWQPLGTSLGYDTPDLVKAGGFADAHDGAMGRCAALYEKISASEPELAPYAVPLGFKVRYSIQMNAREAMHLCELRSAPAGHLVYRAIAQEMHRLIGEEAGHRLIADAMVFVNHDDDGLGRRAAEARTEAKRALRANTTVETTAS